MAPLLLHILCPLSRYPDPRLVRFLPRLRRANRTKSTLPSLQNQSHSHQSVRHTRHRHSLPSSQRLDYLRRLLVPLSHRRTFTLCKPLLTPTPITSSIAGQIRRCVVHNVLAHHLLHMDAVLHDPLGPALTLEGKPWLLCVIDQ